MNVVSPTHATAVLPSPRKRRCGGKDAGSLGFVAAAAVAALAVLLGSTPASAQNLVVNGDFSLGNTGFTSGYTYYTTTGGQQPEGKYSIGTNPQSYHTAWASFGDHTTGTGNMIMFNGSSVAGTKAWTSSGIAVTSNTQYYFSTWVASVYPISPAILQFSVNNTPIGGNFTASTTTGLWQQFYVGWNSGSSTTADLTMLNQNTTASGNDFALDDIKFSTTAPTVGVNAAAPEPGAFSLLGLGLTLGASGVGTLRIVRRQQLGKATGRQAA